MIQGRDQTIQIPYSPAIISIDPLLGWQAEHQGAGSDGHQDHPEILRRQAYGASLLSIEPWVKDHAQGYRIITELRSQRSSLAISSQA
ncbi:hypothetical protein O181_044645 [Austropuccinia psidii MF-1]|uniref:Uncharacterized protein n=1 Tax=Austropuccinia psidii MF-1 TaxID=1389203 RepID=A0A9Q3DKF3_9BASI|nr:hypothetical protein [Austropuccinia psidii MF-1]